MDPSEKACIEVLRPKTVPEGLIAFGTISSVFESHIKIQIPDGVNCIIDQQNINKVYREQLEKYAETHDPNDQPPKLTELFKKGQQYACKIIDRVSRKGYADANDIIATMDPSAIYEDSISSTLLAINHVPMQCVVQSVEDHVYQMDIGFKGLMGSLSLEDAEDYCSCHNQNKKLRVSQVIRCCLKEPVVLSPDVRVVHLSLKKSNLDSNPFADDKISDYLITERCILPGSTSFLTVMKVLNNGLLVNFMNEFSGFVGLNHLKEDWHSTKKNYKISDHIDCTVLYYNCTTKTFALSLKHPSSAAKTLDKLLVDYHPGKFIDSAQVVFKFGPKAVYFKTNDNLKAVSIAKDALEEDPGTLTKDELLTALDTTYPEGSKHKCRVKSINYADLILVVGLRSEFLNLRHLSSEELNPGDFLDAIVKKYTKDGIVVSFGLNIRAIILNTFLQDFVSQTSYKKYPVGQSITCRVLKVDSKKQPTKLYFTNKKELLDNKVPILKSYDGSWKGKSAYGTVIKVGKSGLIIEFFGNVKGFLPNRFLSSVPLKNPGQLCKIGQTIMCTIYRIDPVIPSLNLAVISFKKIVEMKKERKKEMKTKAEIRLAKKIDAKLDRNIDRATKLPKVDKTKSNKNKKRGDEENEVRFVSSDSDIEEKNTDYVFDLGGSSDEEEEGRNQSDSDDGPKEPMTKSRLQRSEEAMLREKSLRDAEKEMLDPDRPPQSILDFERLVLKNPNAAEIWTKYSKFFLNNVETEKARIVCRRALQTINFRLEKEKLKVWLHLIKIEARYGGIESLHKVIDEAAQTNDKITLYQGVSKVLINSNELDEADRIFELMLKLDSMSLDIWMSYIEFVLEQRKNPEQARALFLKACKSISKSDLISLKSRFARLEFKSGDVERGKTVFENLLNDNPKRTDMWLMFEAMIKKYGTRQVDSEEVRERNMQTLKRIAESTETVRKKAKRR